MESNSLNKILDEFKKSMPTMKLMDVNAQERLKEKCLKRKLSNFYEEQTDDAHSSPWQFRNMKADLTETKVRIAELEDTQKKHLENINKEMQLYFDKEKDLFKQENERLKNKIQILESKLTLLKQRENEKKEDVIYLQRLIEDNNSKYEESLRNLEIKNLELKDKMNEDNLKIHDIRSSSELEINELKLKLQSFDEENEHLKQEISDMQSRMKDLLTNQAEYEKNSLKATLLENFKKELESMEEEYKVTVELVDSQKNKLLQFPEMEKQISFLQKENERIRGVIHNNLILEEKVNNLEEKQKKMDKCEEELIKLRTKCIYQETELELWKTVGNNYIIGEKCDPQVLGNRIEQLQQNEQILTEGKLTLERELKSAGEKNAMLTFQLTMANKDISSLKSQEEDRISSIQKFKKTVSVLSKLRDSYRSQIDAYEKDMSEWSSISSNTINRQQQLRIEALESAVNRYQDMVQKMGAEKEATKEKDCANLEKEIVALQSKCSELERANEVLLKRRNELEIELEKVAVSDKFNPLTTKILHLKNNPASAAVDKVCEDFKNLEKERVYLSERVRVLEEGNQLDVTRIVTERVESSSSQEAKDLREQLKSTELKSLRLKEVFKKTIQNHRDVCYMLFGYKMDLISDNVYQVSNMYAESPDDFLHFKLKKNGEIQFLETPFRQSLSDFINETLHQHDSLPMFLSTLTINLFQKQTIL